MVETLEKDVTKAKSQEVNSDIYLKTSKLITGGKIDQKTLANRINYSPAAISTYLKKDYKGDLNKFELALKKYLTQHNTVQNYKKISLNFEKTSIANRIFQTAQMCQLNSEIGICYGSSGLGKTTAIKQYAKEGSGVIIVDPNENATHRAVLKQIAEQLKMTEFDQLMENFADDIVKRLKHSNYLVIVDESENLNASSFRMLRKIHDRCDFSFGLLFMGTEKLYANVVKLKGEFAYITNRIGYAEKLDSLKKGDVELLVKQVFPDCSDEDIKTFTAQTNKNARVLFNTIKRTYDLVASGAELNQATITSARKMLLM